MSELKGQILGLLLVVVIFATIAVAFKASVNEQLSEIATKEDSIMLSMAHHKVVTNGYTL
ncbi:MAG: hypothetical protein BWY30_01067 [Tenericutes bacterium ADurb.Bin239]|jgi:hypothetical protein|nr:MAG: hypothetical protein BWY30_01067 [Tenericutes bacterium ADurb.Bin239]